MVLVELLWFNAFFFIVTNFFLYFVSGEYTEVELEKKRLNCKYSDSNSQKIKVSVIFRYGMSVKCLKPKKNCG